MLEAAKMKKKKIPDEMRQKRFVSEGNGEGGRGVRCTYAYTQHRRA